MSQVKVGHFTADGELIYLPIGFVPDFFQIWDFTTACLGHTWFSRMETDEASGSQEGINDDADGTYSKLADDGGFAAYDSGSQGPTISSYTTTVSTNATARTATAHGTYVRPSTSSSADRSAVFECLTAGTGTAEPTWPTEIGEQVLDNDVLYEKVNIAEERIGYKGVRIAAALMTDGQEMYYLAIEADESVDHGDVDGWTSGVYGA